MAVKVGDVIQHPDQKSSLVVVSAGGEDPGSHVILSMTSDDGNKTAEIVTNQRAVEWAGYKVVN